MINFFCSVEHLEAWQEDHPEVGGDAVTLVEAAATGRQNWKRARET